MIKERWKFRGEFGDLTLRGRGDGPSASFAALTGFDMFASHAPSSIESSAALTTGPWSPRGGLWSLTEVQSSKLKVQKKRQMPRPSPKTPRCLVELCFLNPGAFLEL